MEGLHMALNDGLVANMFHGVKVGSLGMHLSHILYANDVIILSEWNLNVMENIIRILNIFYIASGLKINIHKSNVSGVGVSSNEVEIMASYTGCEAGFFPFTYLGLPIGSNMRRITNWQPLIDRFKASSEDSKKLALVKWSNILPPLIKEVIHGDEARIDIRGCHTNGVCASIVGSIFHLYSSAIVPLNSIRFKVCDGSSIRFWKDTCRPVNVGRTKAEFDAFISDNASLEPKELVDSDTYRLPSRLNLSSRGLDIDSIMFYVPFLFLTWQVGLGFRLGMPQRKRRTALTPSLLLPVGPYGGLEIISLSTLIL
ncbi:hypothetical protein Tco_0305370 [Tanacetum coccineum]